MYYNNSPFLTPKLCIYLPGLINKARISKILRHSSILFFACFNSAFDFFQISTRFLILIIWIVANKFLVNSVLLAILESSFSYCVESRTDSQGF